MNSMPKPSRRKHLVQRQPVTVGQGWETSLVRSPGQYPQRYVALVATNGKETEKQYIAGLKTEPWVREASKIVDRFFNGSPLDALRHVKRLQQADDYDAVWLVCDVDHYDPAEVAAEARGSEVQLAWSNPCFEVWLILHREDCTRHFDGPRKVETRLTRVMNGSWDKSNIGYARFRDGIFKAVDRAKRLEDPPAGNPSTAFWRLIEALVAAHEEVHGSVDCSCMQEILA